MSNIMQNTSQGYCKNSLINSWPKFFCFRILAIVIFINIWVVVLSLMLLYKNGYVFLSKIACA